MSKWQSSAILQIDAKIIESMKRQSLDYRFAKNVNIVIILFGNSEEINLFGFSSSSSRKKRHIMEREIYDNLAISNINLK